jgi:hypothetical protein
VNTVKKILIIFLSLLIFYSGIAWALEACLRHGVHSDHGTVENRSDSHVLVGHDDPRDPSVPVVYCIPASQEIGPMARIASAQIPRPDKGAALYMVSLSDAVSSQLKNDLWLAAVFRRIVTFSLPIDLARYLFLSVLQI